MPVLIRTKLPVASWKRPEWSSAESGDNNSLRNRDRALVACAVKEGIV
jgi:hypothetical protein